jgi:hypothetical protein
LRCSYELDAKGEPLVASMRLFKTFDPEIQVGDFVVVPTSTRHGMTVNRVEDVDVDVDPHHSGDVPWILSKVDRREAMRSKIIEEEAIVATKRAEKTAQREELKAKLLKDNPHLAELAGAPALAAPPPPAEKIEPDGIDPIRYGTTPGSITDEEI